jgi:hypothetical protein
MPELRATAVGRKVKVLYSAGRYKAMDAPRRYAECRAPEFNLVVGADYKVYACCETKYRSDATLGDLALTSLADILAGIERRSKIGRIYACCPHPCRHDASNALLAEILAGTIHKNFV